MKKLFLLIFAFTLLCTWTAIAADLNTDLTTSSVNEKVSSVEQGDREMIRAEKDALAAQKTQRDAESYLIAGEVEQPLEIGRSISPEEKARLIAKKEAEQRANMPVNSFFDGSFAVPDKPDYDGPVNIPDKNVILQGGDDCASAFPIPGVPYTADGTTVGYTNDYDEVCPYTGSTAPDVVYSYVPEADISVDITLCVGQTDYDTKLYIYENECQLPDDGQEPYACNDDECTAPGGQQYVSALYGVPLYVGNTYYIVVDGYGTESGLYTIEMTEYIPATGACCVGLDCVATTTEAECDAMGGDWYEGQTCPEFQCPEVGDIICPTDGTTLFDQPPHSPEDSWSLGTSEFDVQGNNYRRFEDYTVSGVILDVHWWGVKMILDGSWQNCYEEPMTFDIFFWADAGGVPDVSAPVCAYTVVAQAMPTGRLFAGVYAEYQWEVILPEPCVLQSGWVSIQGMLDPSCWFMIDSSPVGNGSSMFENNGVFEGYAYDLAICLTGEYVPTYGACCDDDTGECFDNIDMVECPAPLRFAANTLCADLIPPCGETGCPDDEIIVEILTDSWGEETTWDIYDAENNFVASGGPYSSNTLYQEQVCVLPDCYTFTIYDAYGDGIYSPGYYDVYYNGVLECGNHDFGGSEESCQVGIGCVDPTGACCVNEVCVATTIEDDCIAMNGDWFEGETCPEFDCPTDPFACPPNTVYSHPIGDFTTAATSEVDPGYKVFDKIEGFSGEICDIHFWGLKAVYDGGWMECVEEPVLFNIEFYPDAGGQPDMNNPTCQYLGIPAVGTNTGVAFAFTTIWRFDISILDPCCVITDGWVSVQGAGDPNCWFLWVNTGNAGNGMQWDGTDLVPLEYSLGLCLTGEYVPTYGACCDDGTAECIDDVEMMDCPAPLRFAANTLCVDLVPPCGEVGCPEDEINIEIFTDNYPSETTWEVLDHETQVVVGSGGPYSDPLTLHTEQVCALYEGCYDFVIYDSYGDGICCANGNGYYNVYLNEELMGSGGEFEFEETTPNIGGGCIPCVVECPEGGIPEVEPCGEDTNGGCNADVPGPDTFEPVSCGVTICGTSSCDGTNRDTDWFIFELTEPTAVTATGMGEFPFQLLTLGQENPPDLCPAYVMDSGVGEPCELVSVTSVLDIGTYYIWVGPMNWDMVFDCGNYYFTLTCAAPPIGACCDIDFNCIGDMNQFDCADAGGVGWYEGETCDNFDCPYPNQVGLATTGNIPDCGVSNYGPIGETDTQGNTYDWSGQGAVDFAGTFVMGNAPDAMFSYYNQDVSDCYNYTATDFLDMSDTYHPTAQYTDGGVIGGVSIDYCGHGYTDPAEAMDIFVHVFTITNTGDVDLTDYYAGIYIDWDINLDEDIITFDRSRNLMYQEGTGLSYLYGLCMINADEIGLTSMGAVSQMDYIYPSGGSPPGGWQMEHLHMVMRLRRRRCLGYLLCRYVLDHEHRPAYHTGW